MGSFSSLVNEPRVLHEEPSTGKGRWTWSMKIRGHNSVTDMTFLCKTVNTLYNRSTSSGIFFSPGIKSQQYLWGEDLEQEEADPRAASSGGLRSREGPAEVLPAPEAVALSAVKTQRAHKSEPSTQGGGPGGSQRRQGVVAPRENVPRKKGPTTSTAARTQGSWEPAPRRVEPLTEPSFSSWCGGPAAAPPARGRTGSSPPAGRSRRGDERRTSRCGF